MTSWLKLAFLLLLLQVGCQQEQNNFLHLNLYEEPTSIDPRFARSIKDLSLVTHLYEGLYRFDLNNELKQALVTNCTVDGLTYTFHLKESYWSDNSPLTAHDFARSWNAILDGSCMTPFAYKLNCIAQVAASDAQTLSVTLKEACPNFLSLLAFPTLFPVKEGCSNGPFTLTSWTDELVCTKNPNYWDAEHVYLDGIVFSCINDSMTECHLFEKGKLDWLGQPLSNSIPEELLAFKKVHSYPVDGTFWLKINLEKAPFNDPNVRQALALAIDRQALIDHVLIGSQSIASGILPPSMHMQAPHLEFNAQKAKALIPKQLPPITLTYCASSRTAKLAQAIAEQWRKHLNIHVKLEAQERHVFRMNRDFQIATGEWIADYHDPLAFLEIFLDTAFNDTHFQNSQFEELITRSNHAENRIDLLQQAHTLLIDAMPIIPLYHYSFDYVKREEIQDVTLTPLGGVDFKSAKK